MRKEVRISLKNGRIAEVDYLRGFSILTIVLMHFFQNYVKSAPGILKTMASVGGTGVHVFFLCSGLGLAISYAKRPLSYGQFLKKRLTKIYLPYILVIVVSFFLPYLYEGTDRLGALLSHIFLYKMFIPEYESSFGTQFWFISTIIQFYLLFIPLMKVKRRFRSDGKFVLCAAAVSVFWWIFVALIGQSAQRVWNSFFPQYLWEFALGMYLGDRLVQGKTIRLRKGVLAAAAVCGIGLQCAMALCGDTFRIFNDVPALAGYLSLALLLYACPVIRWIGARVSGIGYELYLLHILAASTLFVLLQPFGLIAEAATALAALALSLAAAFGYKKLEKLAGLI